MALGLVALMCDEELARTIQLIIAWRTSVTRIEAPGGGRAGAQARTQWWISASGLMRSKGR